MRFEPVGPRATDLASSTRLSTTALGLRVENRGDARSSGGRKRVLLRDPRSHRVVGLNGYRKGSWHYFPFSVGEEVDHLDFSGGAVERGVLEAARERLLRHGARSTRWTPSTTEGSVASVRDRDGIWITVTRRPTPAGRRAMTRR